MHPARVHSQMFRAGLLLLACLLRLPSLSSRPLWYDEAFAALFSEKGPARMLVGTLTPVGGAAADVHPILYYTGLWMWMQAVGQSPLAVRWLSVLLGLLTLAFVYRLARELFGWKGALACGLVVALSPFHVHYSQETRMYSLLALWLVAATWAYRRALGAGGWKPWAAFALLAALAQYTHNLAALYLVSLALTPIWLRKWRQAGQTALAGLIAIALYSPWLLLAPSQFAKLQQAYWTQRPGIAELLRSLIAFTVNLPLPASWLPAGLAVALGAGALATFQLARAVRLGSPEARSAMWLLYLGLAPLALMFAISQWQPVYIERALLPSALMFVCALVYALVHAGMPKSVSVVVLGAWGLVAAVSLQFHYTTDAFPNSPFQTAVAFLRAQDLSQARIVHSNKLSMLPSVYYDRSLSQAYVADPPGSGSDTLALPTQDVLGLLADPDIESAVGAASTVYLVIFERAIAEFVEQDQPTHPHLAWLEAHYQRHTVHRFNDLLVYEFVRQGTG